LKRVLAIYMQIEHEDGWQQWRQCRCPQNRSSRTCLVAVPIKTIVKYLFVTWFKPDEFCYIVQHTDRAKYALEYVSRFTVSLVYIQDVKFFRFYFSSTFLFMKEYVYSSLNIIFIRKMWHILNSYDVLLNYLNYSESGNELFSHVFQLWIYSYLVFTLFCKRVKSDLSIRPEAWSNSRTAKGTFIKPYKVDL
jgi:hypothetical protein